MEKKQDVVISKAIAKGKPALPPIDPKGKPLAGGIYEKDKASNPFPKTDKDFPNGKN